METTGAVGRPLGPQERMYYTLHKEGGMQLTVALVIASTQQCPVKLLKDTCQLLAQYHPLLRMRVARDASHQLVFETIPELKVNFAVNDSPSLESVMEKEVTTPIYDKEGLMWRTTYLPNATPEFTTETHPYQITQIFTFSHVVADASACALFALDFFRFLEQLHTSGEVLEVISRPMPPDIMEFADQYLDRKSFRVPADGTLQHHLQAGLQQNVLDRNQWSNCLAFRPEDTSSKPGVGILRARLSVKSTKKVVAEAKKHQVTVSSLLTAAVSVAVHQMLPSEQSEVMTIVTGELRRMAAAATGDTDVMQHAAVLSLVFWLHPLTLNVNNEADIWMLAAQCQKQFFGTNILAKVFAVLQSYDEKELNEEGLPKLRVERRGSTFADIGMNNMGPVPGFERPDTAPFKVVDFFGCSGDHYTGKPVNVNVFTINNAMTFCLPYLTHMLSKQIAAELLKRFIAVLTDVIGD